jgi:hypothetical protein
LFHACYEQFVEEAHTMDTTAEPLIRIVNGRLADHDLAALTSVLMARVVAGRGDVDGNSDGSHPRANWNLRSYRSPASWK